jgi:hypothetical protein
LSFELVLHVAFPQHRPEVGTRWLGQGSRQFLQGQAQRLAHALQGAQVSHGPQHVRRVQSLPGALRNEAFGLQGLEHRPEGQVTLGMFEQPLPEIHQRGRVKPWIAQFQIQCEFPAQVVFDHLDGLAVGHPFQELKDEDAQQHHRFHAGSSVVAGVTFGKLFSAPGQHRPNFPGKKLVFVLIAEQLRGDRAEALEQRPLHVELRQAHL